MVISFARCILCCRLLNTIAYRLVQYIHVDILQRFEFDAIPGYAGLTYGFAIGLSQVFFVSDADDIHGDSGGVCAGIPELRVDGIASIG